MSSVPPGQRAGSALYLNFHRGSQTYFTTSTVCLIAHCPPGRALIWACRATAFENSFRHRVQAVLSAMIVTARARDCPGVSGRARFRQACTEDTQGIEISCDWACRRIFYYVLGMGL